LTNWTWSITIKKLAVDVSSYTSTVSQNKLLCSSCRRTCKHTLILIINCVPWNTSAALTWRWCITYTVCNVTIDTCTVCIFVLRGRTVCNDRILDTKAFINRETGLTLSTESIWISCLAFLWLLNASVVAEEVSCNANCADTTSVNWTIIHFWGTKIRRI